LPLALQVKLFMKQLWYFWNAIDFVILTYVVQNCCK